MKRYSYKLRDLREQDNEIVKFREELDALVTSEEFINNFRVYVEDIARFKRSGGRKFLRSTEYAAVGILDMNDLYQEAYLAFFEAYSRYKDKPDEAFSDGADVWAYLKKTTILNFESQIRSKKDGIRVTHHGQFVAKQLAETNMLTKLFSRLEVVFSNNVVEVATSKWDTDLTGLFLEVHMDELLDLTRTGKRDLKKMERAIIKSLYGIDCVKKSYKELSEEYRISQSTIRSVKERAIKRLQSLESKEKIAYFLKEYRISTKANIENYIK